MSQLVPAGLHFAGYIMLADGGLKGWKTYHCVLRFNAKTLDFYKDPISTKIKESILLQGSTLYTFPSDCVTTFGKNANLFGLIQPTRKSQDGVSIINCSQAEDRQQLIDGLTKLGVTNCGEKGYIPIVPDSLFEGKLDKFGGTVKTRKTRYFVLQPQQLAYYDKRTDSRPKGTVKLSAMSSVFVAGLTGHPYGGPMTQSGGPGTPLEADTIHGFTVLSEPGARPYKLVASDAEERDKWIDAIKKAIGGREKSATVSGISAKLSLLQSMPTREIAPASNLGPRSSFGSVAGSRGSIAVIRTPSTAAVALIPEHKQLPPSAEDPTDTNSAGHSNHSSNGLEPDPPLFEIIRMVTSDEPYDDLDVENMCQSIGLAGVEDLLGLADFNLDDIGLPPALKTKFKKYLMGHLGPDVQIIENKPSVLATVASVAAKKEAEANAWVAAERPYMPARKPSTAGAPPIPARPAGLSVTAPPPNRAATGSNTTAPTTSTPAVAAAATGKPAAITTAGAASVATPAPTASAAPTAVVSPPPVNTAANGGTAPATSVTEVKDVKTSSHTKDSGDEAGSHGGGSGKDSGSAPSSAPGSANNSGKFTTDDMPPGDAKDAKKYDDKRDSMMSLMMTLDGGDSSDDDPDIDGSAGGHGGSDGKDQKDSKRYEEDGGGVTVSMTGGIDEDEDEPPPPPPPAEGRGSEVLSEPPAKGSDDDEVPPPAPPQPAGMKGGLLGGADRHDPNYDPSYAISEKERDREEKERVISSLQRPPSYRPPSAVSAASAAANGSTAASSTSSQVAEPDDDDRARISTLSNNPLHPQIGLLATQYHPGIALSPSATAGGASSDDEDEVQFADNAAALTPLRVTPAVKPTAPAAAAPASSSKKLIRPSVAPPPPPPRTTVASSFVVPSTTRPSSNAVVAGAPPPNPLGVRVRSATTVPSTAPPSANTTTSVPVQTSSAHPVGQSEFSAPVVQSADDGEMPPLPESPSPSGTPPPPPVSGNESPKPPVALLASPDSGAGGKPLMALPVRPSVSMFAPPPGTKSGPPVAIRAHAGSGAFDAIYHQLGGDLNALKAHFDLFVKTMEAQQAASAAANHAGPIVPSVASPPPSSGISAPLLARPAVIAAPPAVPPRPAAETAASYRKALSHGRVSLMMSAMAAEVNRSPTSPPGVTSPPSAGSSDSTPGATSPNGVVPTSALTRSMPTIPGNPQLASLLVNKARILHIHCMEGFNMPAMDKNGLSDPFAVLKIRTTNERDTGKEDKKTDLSYTTKIIYESLHPVWSEFCSLAFGNYSDELIIDVYDYDKYSTNDYIGRVVIPLITLVGQKPVPKWYNLLDKHEENIVQGCILLRLVTDDQFTPKGERDSAKFGARRAELLQVKSPLPSAPLPANPVVQSFYHDDSLQSGLAQPLNLFMTTWNIGNAPPPESLDAWILPNYDMYVIAAQECNYTARGDLQTASFDWLASLIRHFGKEHTLVKYHCLWDIRLAIFVANQHRKRISNVHAATEATGIGNVLGNKGGVIISLTYNHTDLCFVASHLAAHQDKTKARNKNVRDIIKNIKVGAGAHSDIANEYYHIFWMGDLNYRLEYGNQGIQKSPSMAQFDDMVKKIGEAKLDELYQSDQLLRERKADRVFTGFVEGSYNFKPTFKVARHVDTLRYEPSRSPAWCDRVLWKSASPHLKIKQTTFNSVELVRTSDHKPVVSTFEVETWTLPPGSDEANTARTVAISFPQLRLEGFRPHGPVDPDPDPKHIEQMAREKQKPIHAVELYVRFSSPCLAKPYTTNYDKATVDHKWLQNYPAPLQYNSFDRLTKTLFKVHLVNKTKSELIIGRGLISLAGMNFVDEKQRLCVVDVNCVLTYEGVSIGVLKGALRLDWKGDYPMGTTIPIQKS